MTRHVQTCLQAREAAAHASATRKSKPARTFHLVVQGRYNPEYWLHLEAPVELRFADLDNVLRRVWLECCGHLSAFRFTQGAGAAIPSDFDEVAAEGECMRAKLGSLLRPGTEFFHEYDFGSTTELALKVIAEGARGKRDNTIQILARNDPPAIPCGLCGRAATQVCSECGYDAAGWLCDKCAGEHQCGEDMLLPVVNSPRVGVCAYTGE